MDPFAACAVTHAVGDNPSLIQKNKDQGTRSPYNNNTNNNPPSSSLVDLRSQVELHVPVLCHIEIVLHHQWCIWAETELHCATQRSGLRKVHQVAQSKGCGDRLLHCESNLFSWVLAFPGLQQNVASANVALDAKLEPVLAGTELDGFSELLEVSADLLKLRGRHANRNLVVLLRDLHVLALDLHQLEVEVRNAVLARLALEVHGICLVLPADLQSIVWATHLEDFAQGVNVHSQGTRSVALELREAGLTEHQRHQSHMRAVHGLNLNAFLSAVKVDILAEVLHGIHHLLQEAGLSEMSFERHS
mmetsp:Transcript_87620/g.157913  ORF Transcript_87620/g.157913 Transcript_87620/m.157913 type:complete len:304 (-) Transcript_87620:128-1039(-)